MLFLNSRLRILDVPDGLSTTLLIAEKMPLGIDLGWMSGTRSSLRNTGSILFHQSRFNAARSQFQLETIAVALHLVT